MEVGKGEATLLAGGHRLTDGNLANGLFPAPTMFDHVSPDARIATEEIFGWLLASATMVIIAVTVLFLYREIAPEQKQSGLHKKMEQRRPDLSDDS